MKKILTQKERTNRYYQKKTGEGFIKSCFWIKPKDKPKFKALQKKLYPETKD